ncbi:hypothetical protein Tco_1081486 [Tanacetum coccineum]|uniref:Reverse transcriptase domain-containing protein n=1 Tax=Tanacetum coccineum TaxID=301880 RepID=A0ABQ5HXJ8_9ASTR
MEILPVSTSNNTAVGTYDGVTTSSNTVIFITTCSCSNDKDKYMMKAQCILNDKVAEAFVSHYEKFLGQPGGVGEFDLNDLFKSRLDDNVALHMVRNVSRQEVKDAIFFMGNEKAPGPDGYMAAFFKQAWNIVADDVTNVIIANRIKESLKDIVCPNQSAFVPGHCISNNILLTQELMHNYHLDRGSPRCAFKVDIQKAYDTVDWGFLEKILIGFGFHDRMVKWIMECVTTSSYSICINGSLYGYFKGKRGLRQGDPLSPYLFTMVMEVLTLMLQRKVQESNSFTYHRYCSELELINLCFADDLFLFAYEDINSACIIKEALDEFTMASGLTLSLPKSTTYFCNVLNHVKIAILNVLPFEEGCLPVKYLGVPLVSSRLLNRDCKELVEKVQARIQDWKNKSLSIAGRLQLVKSVIGSMHIFWASVFMLPSRILCDLEKIMRSFLWSQDMRRGQSKVAWEVVCLPKDKGGLGLRRLDHFNKALMVSHIWKLLSLKESLWVKWMVVSQLVPITFAKRRNWRLFKKNKEDGKQVIELHYELCPSQTSQHGKLSKSLNDGGAVPRLWNLPDSVYYKVRLMQIEPLDNLGEFNACLILLKDRVGALSLPLQWNDFRDWWKKLKWRDIAMKGAFIPSRQISDNILLSQELMRNYHSNRGLAKCAFKIDIEKAYDSWVMKCVTSLFTINVNGEHKGFFKGMRGLRQGDPLSPYLFTLIMEVLNLVLRREIDKSPVFRYHWLCKDVKLTHLCFAGDLLLFCNGDSHSVSVVKKALLEFTGMSGLVPNSAKSTVFFGNVREISRQNILDIMPFRKGSLPVRYLGVPLISKRLYIKDCLLLIDKAKKRILDWKNKSLSFAGRLQLIKSVVSSMQVYWASMFILPVSIANEIEKLMRDFLWNFGVFKRGKSKVNWKSVCKPKESLWVRWVNTYRLKGRSFWDIPERDGACWAWKKLLKYRGMFREHIFHKIGDGRNTSLWFDKWHPICPLSDFISKRRIATSGLSLYCKVADIISNGMWCWPDELTNRFDALPVIPPPCIVVGKQDKVCWKSDNGKLLDFSAFNVWDDIREKNNLVPWSKLVWFSQCIPRHSFMLWLAILGKLKTHDVMTKLDMNLNKVCVFCGKVPDSHNHLFFACDFPKGVWCELKSMVRLDYAPNSWHDIVEFILKRPINNSIWSILQRLVLGATVYMVWQERNFRTFQDRHRSLEELCNLIKDMVRLRIMGLKDMGQY